MRRSERSTLLLMVLLLTASVLMTVWLLLFDGTHTTLSALQRVNSWIELNYPTAVFVFFIVSLLSQLIIMPSGSLMLLVAGGLLGALPATAAFAVAQLLAAWPVYALSRNAIRPAEAGFTPGIGKQRINSILDKLGSLRGNPVLATALLRLTPVIPSAGACLLAAVCGVALQPFLVGTALTCWIRPLFFSSSGAAMLALITPAHVSDALGRIDVTPLILAFVSAAVLFLLARKFSR